MGEDTGGFLVVLAAAAAAPILVALARRPLARVVVPVVVVELLLGVLIGPEVLDLATSNAITDFLSELGLAFLFFFAGYEIRMGVIRGAPLRLAVQGWLLSLALAYALATGLVALGTVESVLVVGSAMATTALGTLLPILRDAGALESRLGRFVIGSGAVGEFGPVLVVTLLLSAEADTIEQAALLVAFALIAVAAAVFSTRVAGIHAEALERSLETSGQLAIRVTVLLLFALVVIAADLGLDVILGAFAAGAIVRLVVGEREAGPFEAKLEAIGFGFLIPFFFVMSGIRLEVGALGGISSIVELGLFVLLFAVVRGLPALALYRRELERDDRLALALFSATQLPLVVAITGLGVEQGHLDAQTAAAMVCAGALSVLVFPSAGLLLRGARW